MPKESGKERSPGRISLSSVPLSRNFVVLLLNLRLLHRPALTGLPPRLRINFALPLRGTSCPWTATAHRSRWLKKLI